MNRIPPSLLYLTIYNPTLKLSGPIEGDSEDAEEQAHILFYTSREKAVSRDRMLRQVGLAKALISFAESFDSVNPCESVHSQSSRMIMVSPEPHFWIHARVELAKTPRDDVRNKSKSKAKSPDKRKESETTPVYDFDDGSVHDNALRAHILQGYERFKLTHGSFTSITRNLGQLALELQLERFWTVWAWSWDLENKIEFGKDLGPLLHPYFSSAIPLIDEFSQELSTETIPVVLSRRHIIPSRRYTKGCYPTALAAQLSSVIPPTELSRSSDTLNTLASSVDTIKGRQFSQSRTSSDVGTSAGANFLGIPSVNVNVDVKKWNWPDYLTFGKSSSAKLQVNRSSDSEFKRDPQDADSVTTTEADEEEASRLQVEVDTEDLEDAMTSDSLSTLSVTRHGSTNIETAEDSDNLEPNNSISALVMDTSSAANILVESDLKALSSKTSNSPEDLTTLSPQSGPEFSMTNFNLASLQDTTNTRRVAVHYYVRNELMLALIASQDFADDDDDADLRIASKRVTKLLDNLESIIQYGSLQSTADLLPSATKILQAQDQYLISTGQYTQGSPDFFSTADHLFNAKAILDSNITYTEVFSRGQNPQHWHIAKRGIVNAQIFDGINVRREGSVFMEVFRKEASLTDVDNALLGVVKKSGVADTTGPSPMPGNV